MVKWIWVCMLVCLMVLSACSGNGETAVPERPVAPVGSILYEQNETAIDVVTVSAYRAIERLESLHLRFPVAREEQGTMITGGVLHIPVYDMPGRIPPDPGLTGLLHPLLTFSDADVLVGSVINPSLIAIADDGRMILGDNHNGPVIVTADVEARTLTFTMREGVHIFWHDGEELTMDDLKYAFEFMLHPNFHSDNRGTSHILNIIGAEEFQQGITANIYGLQLSEDERTLTLHFHHMSNTLMYQGRILLGIPLPRHHFAGIAFEDIPTHPNSRENILGFGPFKFYRFDQGTEFITIPHSLVRGFATDSLIELVVNPNYWQGMPNLDGVIFHFVPQGVDGLTMLQNGHLDMLRISNETYFDLSTHDDLNFLGHVSPNNILYHFNLGVMFQYDPRFNDSTEMYLVLRDDEHPITDPAFRRAIALAFDAQAEADFNNHPFSVPATSINNPHNASRWINPESSGLGAFNLDLANDILDAAGYEWGANGFRLDLNGDPFYVTMNFGNVARRPLYEKHKANMAAIGVDFRFWRGFGSWPGDEVLFQRTNRPSPNSDLHIINAWSKSALGAPGPNGVWWPDSEINFSAFAHDDLTQIIEDLNSVYAWDEDFHADALYRWDALFNEYAPAILTNWHISLTVVNNRVVNWTLDRGRYTDTALQWHLLGVTH